MHYWYWTSKDQNKEANREREGKLGGWRVDQLEELRRVGSKVEAMLEEGEAGGGARSMGHAKLLHSVWLKLHPESHETEESLAEVRKVNHLIDSIVFIHSFSGASCCQAASDPGKSSAREEEDSDADGRPAGGGSS